MDVWTRHGDEGWFSRLFNLPCLFDKKTCTWKRGHGRHWYVWKEPHHGGVDILNYVNMCVLIFQFILLRYYLDYNNNVFLIGYCQYFGSHCYQCFHFLLLLIIILIYYSILITMFLSSLFVIFIINDTSNFIAFIVIANVVFNTSYRTVLSAN